MFLNFVTPLVALTMIAVQIFDYKKKVEYELECENNFDELTEMGKNGTISWYITSHGKVCMDAGVYLMFICSFLILIAYVFNVWYSYRAFKLKIQEA